MLCHLTPPRIILEIKLDNEQVLLQCPLLLDHVRVKVMMPALAALLANAPWECCCDLSPILGTIGEHELSQEVIFLFGPSCADHVISISQLEIAFMALNFRLAEDFTDAIP